MQKALLFIDRVSTFVGQAFSWLIVVLTLFAPLALLAGHLGSGPGAGLTWLWVAFGVGFIGSRAVVLLHRARGTAWMVTGG